MHHLVDYINSERMRDEFEMSLCGIKVFWKNDLYWYLREYIRYPTAQDTLDKFDITICTKCKEVIPELAWLRYTDL